MIALHICGPNDANGNPQRAYALLDEDDGCANVIAVVDEGYEGERAIVRRYPSATSANLLSTRINVSAAEYRRWLALDPNFARTQPTED